MNGLRRIGMVALTSAAAAGCLLTTSLDGLSGETAEPDVGSPGSPDATDAPQADAPASDAAIDQGDAAPFRCASLRPAPSFCADFDDGTLQTNVGTVITGFGGTIALDDTTSVSPKRSVRMAEGAFADGGNASGVAVMSRHFTFVPSQKITIALDLLLESADKESTNTINIAVGDDYAIALFVGEDGAKLRETRPTGDGGSNVYVATDVTPPPARQWTHLTWTITMAPGKSTSVVAWNGNAQAPVPIVVEKYVAPDWTVRIGLNFLDSPDKGRLLHVDNVVIDGQ